MYHGITGLINPAPLENLAMVSCYSITLEEMVVWTANRMWTYDFF